jgi:hypothetical protein
MPTQDGFDLQPEKIQFRVLQSDEYGLYDRLSPRTSPNEQVRTMLIRYLWLMEESMPDLTEDEKKLIADVTKSTWYSSPEDVQMIWADLEDAKEFEFGYSNVYEKWGVDAESLVERAKEWTPAECAAVVDWAKQFWAGVARDVERHKS